MLRMLQASCLILYLLSAFSPTIQKSTPESPTYVAAVVEYSPQLYELGNHTDKLSKNAERYANLIKEAASQLVDIIVFPEIGLAELGSSTSYSSLIPDPQDKANPCIDTSSRLHEAVRTLSCAAREHEMYVVVNIPEESHDPGDTNNAIYHNTNVVFDRQGQIVARYRKFNLFGEPGFSATEYPDFTIFDTDFGVKFGVFTCFDIIFEKPAVTLVKDMGVKDILFPTAWFSELPFLSAVQAQVFWAYTLDVNFLGSGYNAPGGGSTGSGIYAGKLGVLAAVMATSPTTELLVATVPKKPTQIKDVSSNPPVRLIDSNNDGSGLFMKTDNLGPYTTLPLTEDNSRNEKHKLCNGELCCEFEINMHVSNNNGYKYRLAVFDGVRSFTFKTGGMQICAVIFCTNDSSSSCGLEMNNPEAFSTTFEYINIVGDFRRNGVIVFPNTLLKGYDVMAANNFNFVRQEQPEINVVTVQMEMKASQSSLLTFGIYGRDFQKDGLKETVQDNGVTSIFSSIGLVISAIVAVFFNRSLLLMA